MKRSLLVGLGVLALLVAAAIALPFLIPLSAYRAELEAAGSKATGRAVRIEGPLRLTLLPALGVEADNVTLANVAGGRAPHLAEAGSVQVIVRLIPLLQGHIDVSEIVLTRPAIHLEVDRQGEANWTLARPRSGSHVAHLPTGTHIETVAIEDGRITYDNARAGIARSLDAVQADIVLPGTDRALSARGRFVEHDVPFMVDAKLDDTQALFSGEPTPVALSLSARVLKSKFTGSFARSGDSEGDFSLATPSLKNLAALLGIRLSAPGGLGRLSLTGHIRREPHRETLSKAVLRLDDMNVTGDLVLSTAGRTPTVTGALSVDHIDLNPYLGSPRRHNGPHEEGWSTKPIRLDILRSVDANLALTAGTLDVRRLHIGRSHLSVKLEGGRLDANIDSMTLYGGRGSAVLEVDASGPVATYANRLQLSNVAASGFLADTLGVERIAGTGNLALTVSSRGGDADAIMHNLSGRGTIALTNGQIEGVNLGEVAHTVETMLRGSAVSDSALTSFREMGCSFAIDRGVLETRDFHLANDVLQMTGAGTLDIGGRAIDFRLVPRAVLQEPDGSASDGDGRPQNLGVAVPFHIKGPWTHLSYTPDFTNLVSGVIQNLENGRAPFKDMFGHTNDNDDKKKHKSLGDVLKNMLGVH